jgi:hypothetical protein
MISPVSHVRKFVNSFSIVTHVKKGGAPRTPNSQTGGPLETAALGEFLPKGFSTPLRCSILLRNGTTASKLKVQHPNQLPIKQETGHVYFWYMGEIPIDDGDVRFRVTGHSAEMLMTAS